MSVKDFLNKLDMSKIPEKQLNGFMCAREGIYKTGTSYSYVRDMSDEKIISVMQTYLSNNYISVLDYLRRTETEKIPTIWLDIFNEELEKRHG